MYRRHRECLNKSYFALCSVEYTLHNRDYNCACCVSYTLFPFEINPLDIKNIQSHRNFMVKIPSSHFLRRRFDRCCTSITSCLGWGLSELPFSYYCTVAPQMPVLFIVKKIYFYYTFRKLYIQRIYVDIQSTWTQICLMTFMFVYSTYSIIIHQ